MKLTMLGTGNAAVTDCYNTCFVLEEDGRCFMVDGGGGNGILRQLKLADYSWKQMTEIFVTHCHMDHIMGILWMVRMFCQGIRRGTFEGHVNIYGHKEAVRTIGEMAAMLLSEKEAAVIGREVQLIRVRDGESREIHGRKVTFFNIHSTKLKQFGFSMDIGDGKRLTCCGDEPYCEKNRSYVLDSDWLLHEAFCLYSQADIFKPYEKSHSTVKDACKMAGALGIRNLVLYHTEDRTIKNRKKLYLEEGRQYYHGSLYVPDDLETIELT